MSITTSKTGGAFKMLKKRSFLWLVLFLMAVVLMAGGCGGGGGGDSTPTPNPDPVPPADPEIDFSALSGTWAWSEGTGTASGYGNNYQVRLDEGLSMFEIVNVADAEATVQMIADSLWDVYDGSTLVDQARLHTGGAQQRLVKRTGENSFQYSEPERFVVDITFLSNTRMRVRETGKYTTEGSSGIETYDFSIEFYANKQAATSPDLNPDPDPVPTPDPTVEFSALSGTWTARDGGTGTATSIPYGTLQLRLNQGSVGMNVLSVTDAQAQVDVLLTFSWDVYQSGQYVDTVDLHDGTTDRATVQRTDDNKFRYTYPSGSTIDITIQSDTLAFVEEQGTYVDEYNISYQYQGSYYMDKN